MSTRHVFSAHVVNLKTIARLATREPLPLVRQLTASGYFIWYDSKNRSSDSAGVPQFRVEADRSYNSGTVDVHLPACGGSVVDVREVAHIVNELPNVLIAKLFLRGHGRSGHAAADALEKFLSFGSAPKLA